MSRPTNESEFAGTAVAVIGGHLGTGPAVVRAFAERGARVLIGELAHHSLSEAERAACATPAGSSPVSTFPVDVADVQSIGCFLDQCESRLGGLGIVVIIAPPVKTKNALDIPPEEYRRVIDQELIGPMLCILEAGRRMAVRGGGRIISFSSMSGKTGVHKHVAPYAAARAD